MSKDICYFAHERALVDAGAVVGKNTTIWANAHVMEGAVVGSDCNVGECVFIEKGVRVGDRVTLKNGVQLWAGIVIEDDVFVGPNVTFANDKYPRSKVHLSQYPETRICKGASLGANCTILPGIQVGEGAMVGAGAVVTKNVLASSVVIGNPAKHVRYLHSSQQISSSTTTTTTTTTSSSSSSSSLVEIVVPGVQLLKFPNFKNATGTLCFGQYQSHVPWIIKRFFMIYDTPANISRGHHGHKYASQLMICAAGQVSVLVDDGVHKQEVLLSSPDVGLLLPPMIWSSQVYRLAGSVLLVLSPEEHAPEHYIHDYTTFLALKKEQQQHQQQQALSSSSTTPASSIVAGKVGFLNLKASVKTVEKELHDAFRRVLDSSCFVLGPEVEGFEKEWAEFCGAAYCVGVGSGLAALHLMLEAAGIGFGDEVIVPSNTYIATLLAVSMAKATPVLVEPDARTFNINPDNVESAINEKTKAILSVDLYGQPADMDKLREIARKHKLWFFTDAAQSHGARYKGQTTGGRDLCDATAFSFYPSKNLGALGEAGAVTTNNKELADKIRILRNYGSQKRYYNECKGYNERMDPLQASFLRCKIPKLHELNNHRRETAKLYQASLANLKSVSVPFVPEWADPCWHLFVITCEQRDKLQTHLTSRNIDTIVHYPIPPHLSQAYSDLGFQIGAFPIAEKLANSVLSIPICPFMSLEDKLAVIRAIQDFEQSDQ